MMADARKNEYLLETANLDKNDEAIIRFICAQYLLKDTALERTGRGTQRPMDCSERSSRPHIRGSRVSR